MKEEAAIFKVLSDPTRLGLAVLLASEGEACVCMLAEALDEPDFKISRHLGIMRSAGMVRARRHGTWMHYSLVEPRNRLEKCLHECFRGYPAERETVRTALKRLDEAICAVAENALA